MPAVQKHAARAAFTSDLGTPLLQSHAIQSRAPQGGPQPSRPGSSLLFQFRFSSFRPVLPAALPESHARTAPLRGCRAGPSPVRMLLALPECSEKVFSKFFFRLADSDSELTKVVLEQSF